MNQNSKLKAQLNICSVICGINSGEATKRGPNFTLSVFKSLGSTSDLTQTQYGGFSLKPDQQRNAE